MQKSVLAAIAASLLLTTAASAADLAARPYTKAPAPVAAVYDWTGFYVGLNAGYVSSDPRFDFETRGHYNLAAGDSFGFNANGFMGGVHGGYNWQTSNIVFGLEGSIDYTDLKASAISPFFPGTDTFHTKQEWIATITPRLGVTSGPMLFYVKGGAAFTELRTRIQDLADYNERSEKKVGWTAGGGIEWMASSNWIVGVEGNYYDFGNCCGGLTSNRSLATNGALNSASNHSTRFDDWSVLGRVSYKFGAPVVAKY
ncbi:outer membrane protein [Bradyrhizobium liaoningense]|uniref:outer membrane protein n=1 Tax=Bradyrhizobium liaoningense TaxID=43992 RepID=UPI001BAC8BA4|nr:outer membrane beta-barrel protein [Bradyrhizobium liaoningense]MBR0717422.1 porin family protein [Bradyrhizobium liaoningense]